MLNFDPTTFIAFLGLILGFSFLIFIHELGHFAVAKFVGIKCTQFAIGFGQAMLAYRKGIGVRVGTTEPEYERRIKAWLAEHANSDETAGDRKHDNAAIDRATAALGLGETEYRLNWMPLGGYVKMLGQEDMDPAARSNDPRSFNAKSVGARFWVLSAGVIMNVIFGAIFLALAFSPWLGVQFPAAVVGGVAPGSPAATTFPIEAADDEAFLGLQMGDRILRVNDQPANDFMVVRLATALGSRNTPVNIVVERQTPQGPRELTYPIVPQVSPMDGMLSAGIMPISDLTVEQIKRGRQREADVSPSSPNRNLGITPGMRVTRIADQPVEDYTAYHRMMVAARGEAVPVVLIDPQTQQTIEASVRARPSLTTRRTDTALNLLGMVPATVVIPTPGTPVDGLVEPGDIVTRVGTVAFPSTGQLAEVVREAGSDPVPVAVWRDGQEIELGGIRPRGGRLGVFMSPAYDEAIIGSILPDSAAHTMQESMGDPLPSGSRIIAVDGVAVSTWSQVQIELMERAAVGKPAVELTIQLRVAGEPTIVTQLPLDEAAAEALADAQWYDSREIGFSMLNVTIRGDGLVAAAGIGVRKTHEFMLQTYLTLLRLIQGTVKMEHLRGPVGIVDEGTRIATRGFPYLLFFLGLISINLAVINFLPIPIVDGGHIVFLAIEKLKGSPVSVKVQTWASLAGLAVIAFVFLTTLWYDVTRLINGS